MIIARYGSTWAGGYVLPNGMMIDDYGTDRASIASRVGGLDGVFDYLGDDANPIAPVRVRKTAIISATSWAGVETALDTLRAALTGEESCLWGECRDGTHRWAYAKCVLIGDADKTGQYLHCPIEIEFLLPEGLWYGETQHVENESEGAYTWNNAGNVPATLFVWTSCDAALSSTTIANATNGSGWTLDLSAIGNYSTDVDPAAYSVVAHGGSTDRFDQLTPAQPGRLWLTLDPGDNSLTSSSVGGTSTGWEFRWYDT
ncbi:MAG: hypothetical protein HGB05_22650, partial [Chloroflexi bacterium]|nr:hypothetical protein [Chloroflexota bacterium]